MPNVTVDIALGLCWPQSTIKASPCYEETDAGCRIRVGRESWPVIIPDHSDAFSLAEEGDEPDLMCVVSMIRVRIETHDLSPFGGKSFHSHWGDQIAEFQAGMTVAKLWSEHAFGLWQVIPEDQTE